MGNSHYACMLSDHSMNIGKQPQCEATESTKTNIGWEGTRTSNLASEFRTPASLPINCRVRRGFYEFTDEEKGLNKHGQFNAFVFSSEINW